MTKRNTMPTFDEMMNPVLQALHQLGESATSDQLAKTVSEIMSISDSLLTIQHSYKGAQHTAIGSEFKYRLSWAKTYLKKAGLIENRNRTLWVLTDEGRRNREVDARKIVRDIRKE